MQRLLSSTALVLPVSVSVILITVLRGQGTPNTQKSAAVDQIFRSVDRNDGPGAAVLVVHKGKVVHRKGYGMADLEQGIKISPTSVFDIASVSKQFCGLAIAMLVEQGRLSMDDDVRKHVPFVPEFGGRKITIRHLVHHTSGIRDWPGTLRLGGWRFDDVITFEQILRMLRKQRDLNFDPGAEYSYSNTGYNLLAHTIEKVSGVSFATWTKGHFFDPLGMRDTHFHDDHTRVVARRVTAYRQVKGGWNRITNNLTAVGSSSLFTTIDDLASWISMFETKKVAGEAALERMHTRGTLNDGKRISYCFGVSMGTHRGLDTVAHSGSWAGFKTHLVRYPEQQFAVVVLANTATVNPMRRSQDIAKVYLAEAMKPVRPRRGGKFSAGARSDKQPAVDLDDFKGRYHSAELDTTYEIARRDKNLVMLHFKNSEVELRQARTKDRFHSFQSWASTVRFERDDKGGVKAMFVSSSRSRNIRFDRVATR